VDKQLSFKSSILILLLLLVGVFVFKAHIKSLHAKSASSAIANIDCYRAEILMRMANIITTFPQPKLIIQTNNYGSNTKAKIITEAVELLDKAVAEQPDRIAILCKKIILESEVRKDFKPDFDKLVSISSASSIPNEKVISIEEQKLNNLILLLYAGNHARFLSSEFLELRNDADNILKSTLSDGWYKEMALLKVYTIENQNNKYEKLLSESQNRNWQCCLKLIIVGVAAIISTLVGVIIILYQLLISNKEIPLSTEIPAAIEKKIPVALFSPELSNNLIASESGRSKINWQTVSIFFLGWFLTQVFVAYIASVLRQKGLVISYSNSLSSALSIGLVYLLSNGTALLYVYFFAFKPNGLKFSDGLNLRLKVSNHGTIALVIMGLLGWFAAMPIVLASALVSAYCFGSAGSSNPIISIVMGAAQANDFIAILLFYFTLGILAPLCEESLFRGFLYGYLRSRHGILISNILSSALFSLAHLDPGAMLPLFCLGSVFAYLTEKTGSIVPSMIAHGLWNSATFTLVLLLFGN
jgi:uncharacterized protein